MTGCRGNFEHAVVASSGPDAKSFLCKVTGVRFVPRETVGKLVQRLVITRHQTFKVYALSHIASLKLRAANASIVPGNLPGTNAIFVHLTCKWE